MLSPLTVKNWNTYNYILVYFNWNTCNFILVYFRLLRLLQRVKFIKTGMNRKLCWVITNQSLKALNQTLCEKTSTFGFLGKCEYSRQLY